MFGFRFRLVLVDIVLHLHDLFEPRHKQQIGGPNVNLRNRTSSLRAAEKCPHGLLLTQPIERLRISLSERVVRDRTGGHQ